MSAWNARTEADREDAASADSEEKDVKIPVEDANEAKVQDADVEGADTVEPSEEEMVAAAIAAGEQAANDDFKLKYEAARDELAELRNQVKDAEEAKKAAEDKAHEAADRVNRLQADWENYRRRTAKEAWRSAIARPRSSSAACCRWWMTWSAPSSMPARSSLTMHPGSSWTAWMPCAPS